MDVVIVRENEEDLYAGIEHQQTDDVVQCLKLISRPGCEKIVRYAFEYARRNNRKKVTCFTKDNIMKMTDGLFHKVFDEIARGVSRHRERALDRRHRRGEDGRHAGSVRRDRDAESVRRHPVRRCRADRRHRSAWPARRTSAITCAMFEAIHGSAPRRAGQNLANPSGLLLGAVMMLVHIDQPDVAERVHNAWLRTLEDGIHTYDIYNEGVSARRRSARRSSRRRSSRASARSRRSSKPVSYAKAREGRRRPASPPSRARAKKEYVGRRRVPRLDRRRRDRARAVAGGACGGDLTLQSMIDNRGVKVYPGGSARRRLLGRHVALPLHERADRRAVTHAQCSSRAAARVTRRRLRRRQDRDACSTFDGSAATRSARDSRNVAIGNRQMSKPLVAVIMGSKSDWETMRHAVEMLERFGVPHEKHDRLGASHAASGWRSSRKRPRARGIEVIIAGAGGAAHLPGMVAAHTRAAGARRARAESRRSRARLAALHRADAGRRAGRHAGDRQGRARPTRGCSRSRFSRTSRPELRERAARVSATSRPRRVREDRLP